MSRLPPFRRAPRGITLIEVTVSMAVLLIGMLGMAHMQVVAVRQNQFSANVTRASALGQGLVENVAMWRYNDERLTPLATVNSLDDELIQKRFDLPRDEDLSADADRMMQFGEAGNDPSATNDDALGEFDGALSEVDADGNPIFRRYWNVFGWDPDGDGLENAKFVLIVVRWREPNLGMRQVYTTAVKANEEVYSL